MTETQRNDLAKRVRLALERARLVVVVGWKASNHDTFTRSLPQNRVRFYEKAPIAYPGSAGIVLFTRFTKHSDVEKSRGERNTYPHILGNGEIKAVLQINKELLLPTQPIADTENRPDPDKEKSPFSEDVVHHTQSEDPEIAFALEFATEAEGSPDSSLSRYEAARILRKYFGEVANPSRFPNLLSPVESGHKRTGRYVLAEGIRVRLEGRVGPVSRPNQPEAQDSLSKARRLIEGEESVRSKIAELEAEVARLQGELGKIEQAKEMIRKLDELMGS